MLTILRWSKHHIVNHAGLTDQTECVCLNEASIIAWACNYPSDYKAQHACHIPWWFYHHPNAIFHILAMFIPGPIIFFARVVLVLFTSCGTGRIPTLNSRSYVRQSGSRDECSNLPHIIVFEHSLLSVYEWLNHDSIMISSDLTMKMPIALFV